MRLNPAPGNEPQIQAPAASGTAQPASSAESYSVRVDGKVYEVEVAPSGTLTSVQAVGGTDESVPQATSVQGSETLNAPLAGNIFKVLVGPGDQVSKGDVVIIMEAMKMETEVRAATDATIVDVQIKEGDAVQSGQTLLTLG